MYENQIAQFDKLFRAISSNPEAPRLAIKLATRLRVEAHYPQALERIAAATLSPHKDLARAWAWAKPAVRGLSEVFGLKMSVEKSTGCATISYSRELTIDDLVSFRQSNLKDHAAFSKWLKTWRDEIRNAAKDEKAAQKLIPAIPEEFAGKSKRELAQEILTLRMERERLQKEVGRLEAILAAKNREEDKAEDDAEA